RKDQGILTVELAGDWLEESLMPDVAAAEQELSAAPVTALEFNAQKLGRWDSALMVRILKLHDICAERQIEFRSQTLPAGLARLIALSHAVPEKKDAARRYEAQPLLQRIGQYGLDAWSGGRAMLTFMGENVLALGKLLRGRAQFRWSDTFLAIQ